MQYDIFISHASEDKDSFVRLLANKLQENRIDVWYDELSLQLGDSLRQSIDKGLAQSRIGIVVLSKHFFKKKWTNWDLDGLVSRHMLENTESSLIIPIWHNITKEEITSYSPSLADKVAIISSENIDSIVSKIDKILNPSGSTLIIARQYLLKKGFTPPSITDDWWLYMLELYGKENRSYNSYLSFDLSYRERYVRMPFLRKKNSTIVNSPSGGGNSIAKYILQKNWQEIAKNKSINQLTEPNIVLSFLENTPWLKEVSLNDPGRIATFFPQLTIATYGGFLEERFKKFQEDSKNIFIRMSFPKYIPINSETLFMLSDQSYFGKHSSIVAKTYFGEEFKMQTNDNIDNIIWLLSSKSDWLPKPIKNTLIAGMRQNRNWLWDVDHSLSGYNKIYEDPDYRFLKPRSNFCKELKEVKDKSHIFSKEAVKDLEERFRYAIDFLNISEDYEIIVDRFINLGFIATIIESKRIDLN